VQWDASCVSTCNDTCGGCGQSASDRDTLDRLIDGAVERGATVGELLSALKDRILTDGAVDAEEASLMEAVVGVPLELSVEEAIDDPAFETATRMLCGALLRTPDFLLELERSTPGEVPSLALDVDADCARMEDLMAAVGSPVACPVTMP
jgi:hypothetical protein